MSHTTIEHKLREEERHERQVCSSAEHEHA